MNKIVASLIIILAVFSHAQNKSDSYKDAMEAYRAANYPAAVKIFNKFIGEYESGDETYASAVFYLGESYFNLAQNKAAATYYEFLVNNNKWTNYRDISLFRLGIIYFGDGKYELSRERFNRLLSLYPGNEFTGTALYWIGESFIRQGKTAEAIEFLENAIENRNNNTLLDNTIFSLASAYEKAGDYENAVKYYDRLLSYHRNSPLAIKAQIRIGICYFNLKDYESSILELNNPMLLNLPENLYSESLYLLANSYFKTGSYSKAEKIYREIIDRYPESDVIREVKYALAWSLFQEKDYSNAFLIFDSLSEGGDSIAEKSFLWKSEAKRYSGEQGIAFIIYQQFLDKYPESDYRGYVYYQMGVVNYDSKKTDLSEGYLSSAVNSADPLIRAKAFTLKGEIDLEKKRYQSARDNFENAVELFTADEEITSRAYLGLGAALFYLKEYDQALVYLNRISIESPQFEADKVNYYIAENLYAAGKFTDAISRYSQISGEDSELAGRSMFGKAYANFNLGRYDQAASLFSDFIKKYPEDMNAGDARIRLADSYYGNKNYAAASNVYRDIFARSGIKVDNPHLYFQYAQALYRDGKTNDAISKFYEIREKFPNSDYAPRAYYMVGWIYFQKSDYRNAISQYNNTLELYPGGQLAPVIYYSVGDAYYNMGKYDSAITSYQKIITLFPGSSNVYDALNGIQYSYIALGQPDKAIEKIEQYISANPGSDFADQLSFKISEIYYSNKEYEKSKNSFKKLINNFRNSKLVPDSYYWIGKSAQNLNQNEEAVFNYNMIIENYPKSEMTSSAIIEITSIYNSMKRYDMSVRLLDQIIAGTDNESPRKSEFLYLKGTALSQKGDTAAAADVFSEVTMYYKNTIFSDKSKFELGLIDMNVKNFSSAEKNFRELAETRSDDLGAKAQFYYGEALYLQKKFSEAVTALVRVRSVFSAYGEWLTKSYLRIGDCYVAMNENDKAADMYRAVLSRNRGDKYGEEAQKKLRSIQ